MNDQTWERKPGGPLTMDRRRFIFGSGAACLMAASGLIGCESKDPSLSEGSLSEGTFAVGSVDDFTVGEAKRFSDGPFFVLRDDRGLWAMTAVCTHRQCTVEAESKDLPCPCHGSVFDFDGNVTHGPASRPLDNLGLTIEDDGTVTVDTAKTVSRGTRVPPSV